MCGFSGIFGKNFKSFKLNKNILNHRGPDKFSSFKNQFGKIYFWRLSIVDEKKGNQPFKKNNVIIFFNS